MENGMGNPSNNDAESALASSMPPLACCYPTGSTVPFPYDTPYPQQIALMDALLQGLQQPMTSTRNNSRGDTSSSSSSAPSPTSILLLESPTGTGKSLSLACASLAWLKYQESQDLSSSCSSSSCNHESQRKCCKSPVAATTTTSSNINNNKQTVQSSSSTSSSPTGIDWLDSYQAPPDNDHEDTITRALQFAQQAREDLNKALEPLQYQPPPPPHNDGKTKNSSIGTTTTTTADEHKEAEETRRRTCREHQVRAAVTASKMRQRRRQRKGVVRQRREANTSAILKSSKENHSSTSHPDEGDFCLPDYRSDTESGKNRHGSKYYDSDDDDDDDNEKNNPWGINRDKSLVDDPARLLEGARLDGSLAASSTHSGHSSPAPQSSSSSSWKTPQSSSTTVTVGQVTPGTGVRKIIYAARTHSQLSQFVQEVRRTHWGKTIRVVALGSRSSGLCSHLSKKNLSESAMTEECLDLQKAKSGGGGGTATSTASSKNNKRSRSTSSTGCPLYDRTAVDTLALNLLAQPTDIEEAARLGATTKTCAYYASRTAVAAAELVVVPYALLLSSQTRQALGLSLRNNLVIVDEGHNLPDAIRSSSTAQLDLTMVQAALDQLVAYTQKYMSRLCGRNLHHLGQLRKICNALVKHLKQAEEEQQRTNAKGANGIEATRSRRQLLSPSEFVIELHIDTINLFPLLRYMERSKLSQKLLGFTSYISKANQQTADRNGTINVNNGKDKDIASTASPALSKHVSPMALVQTFLEKLTFTADQEGKVVTEPPTSSLDRGGARPAMVRYVVLHPAACCKDLLQEPLGLCLVGGTLRPFGFVAAELFDAGSSNTPHNYLHHRRHHEKPDEDDLVEFAGKADVQYKQDRINGGLFQATTSRGRLFTTFTCSHVVPPEHVLLQCVAKVGSTILDVRQPTRHTKSVCDALGQAVLQVCQRVPYGVVVFFPSYSYETFLIEYWKTTPLYQALLNCKCLVREPKSSSQVETTLKRYREAATSSRGALLCSVIGGKLSEGINFANDLARAVIVVGLPYPDPTDPVLVETMALLDKSIADREGRGGGGGPAGSHGTPSSRSCNNNHLYRMTGRAYYQNLCLRAVNQSVGRAIRHAGDYASIILLDARYQRDSRIAAGLPDWLTLSTPDWRQSEQCSTLRNVSQRLEDFFRNTPPA